MFSSEDEVDKNATMDVGKRLFRTYSKEIVRSGVNLSWLNLSMKSTRNGFLQKVLKKNSGFSNSSEICAIMGSSGCGKTALVTLLADQFLNQEQLKFTGKVYLNDVHLSRKDYSQYVKFVNQNDILMPTLTARENLTYSALLQCEGNRSSINEYVGQIIDEMDIDRFADKLIGDHMIRGLSGGEKKLVSIANEMISQPSVLILDEPTSGLDSENALRVINVLKDQAMLGKNIILTIHQPSSRIINQFNRLIILTQGRCVYQGNVLNAHGYFERLGFHCPNNINLCDFFINSTRVKHFSTTDDEESKKLKKLTDAYKSNQKDEIQEFFIRQLEEQKGLDRKILVISSSRKIFTLLQRSVKNSFRHPLVFALQIFQGILIPILHVLVFNNLGLNENSIQARTGVLFHNVNSLLMMSLQVYTISISLEKNLYIKEIKQGYYGILQYFLAKFVSEIPIQFVFTVLFTFIQYFAIPLNTTDNFKFPLFFLISFAIHLTGAAIGYFAGGVSENYEGALIVGSSIAVFMLMFGGFVGNKNSIQVTTRWLTSLSSLRFGFDAMMINEYTGLKINTEIKPLEEFSISGDLITNITSLFVIEGTFILLSIIVFKCKEVFRYKKRALL